MAWTTARDELRFLVSDNVTDHRAYRKKVFGQIDGTNKVFKTFEYRRLTNFTTASAPLGVYVNGVLAPVTSDSLAVGEFEITTAPVDGDLVQATYYFQWFLDGELDSFLVSASRWLQGSDDITTLAPGLKPAALHYAGQDGFHKLSVKYSERMSEIYYLEDAPHADVKSVIDSYAALAKDFDEKAFKLRDDFYSRAGKSLAPRFAMAYGRTKDPTPQR